MLYIKVVEPDKVIKSKGFAKKALIYLLGMVIPRANPDFENQISKVKFWLLEFENKESIPTREIGLNNSGELLMKMPYKKNYGYWIDNNLTYNDFFRHFTIEEISREYFEAKWEVAISD